MVYLIGIGPYRNRRQFHRHLSLRALNAAYEQQAIAASTVAVYPLANLNVHRR
ncbi:hypothetical protein KIN20_035433 [Parelaphostrongylus tenuis]|uniref:Uncharacterized protein n=1 Tax=Parelaphostrongylus tenuis TaxID=148309 RepID=A0AAD5WKF7_PARTN|nr:hypothetical protein KIN20_035433 [Parelaphostrongylus tenuis]